MVYLTANGKRIPMGDELTIETDGRRLYFQSGEAEFEKEYDSVLEILGVMMWLMKNTPKTVVRFKDGEHEFIRKRKYQGYKDQLRL